MLPKNLFTRIPYFTSLSGNIHLLCWKILTDRYLELCPGWQKDPVLLFSAHGFPGNNPKKTPALSLCQNDRKNRRKVTWKLLISTLNSSKCYFNDAKISRNDKTKLAKAPLIFFNPPQLCKRKYFQLLHMEAKTKKIYKTKNNTKKKPGKKITFHLLPYCVLLICWLRVVEAIRETIAFFINASISNFCGYRHSKQIIYTPTWNDKRSRQLVTIVTSEIY